MKMKLILSSLILGSLVLGPVSFAATHEHEKSASVRTVTGCLARGEKDGEYNLNAEDGSVWELHSKGVSLADHVGHTVKVRGRVWHAKMHGAKEATKGTVDPDSHEHGHLRVTGLDMISDSCKR